METSEENNIGANLTDDIEFPLLQRRNPGKTPQGEKIKELIEQLEKTSGDTAARMDDKKKPPTGEEAGTNQHPASPKAAPHQESLPDSSTPSNQPPSEAMNIQSDSPAHGEVASKEESSTNDPNKQENSAADRKNAANDQDTTKATEDSETGNSTEESDTEGQASNKSPTPAVQPVSEEQRKIQEEVIQKEAQATPFKDGAEELDEDEENSEEEASTPVDDKKETPSPASGRKSPSSAVKQGYNNLFNLGKTAVPKRSGLRPQNTGLKKSGRRK